MINVAVIGAGPAGLCAAAHAAAAGAKVTVFERNPKSGRKLYITGKGRCNVTNDVSKELFLSKVVTNPKFLFSAINFLPPQKTITMLEQNGCPLKTERGGRVFPSDDKSSSVISALNKLCESAGVEIITDSLVTSLEKSQRGFILEVNAKSDYVFDKVIIACGGMSYPATGSTGDGYKLAQKLGHTIIEPKPALVPLIVSEDVSSLQGLSLKNVGLRAVYKDKTIYDGFGDMLFTDKGISGPLVLSLSSYTARIEDIHNVTVYIDLKPALTEEKLNERILRDFAEMSNKQFKNGLDMLLPKKLIPYIIKLNKIEPDKQINSVTAAERAALIKLLKNLRFTLKGNEGFNAAVVTSGGVNVSEVNPSTMESKIISGLFFAGEVLDIDALTGGYNIQIALSTGALAGARAGKP